MEDVTRHQEEEKQGKPVPKIYYWREQMTPSIGFSAAEIRTFHATSSEIFSELHVLELGTYVLFNI